MGIWLEIGLILILIVANGVFSMSETAIVSARKARLEQRASRGDAAAAHDLALAHAPNVFLATVQVGITLIGILSGAFGGATLARSVADGLRDLPGIGPHADSVALAIVVLMITYLSLVVGELAPKRIALNQPEAIAARVAGPMQRLSSVAAPVIHLLSASTDGLLRLLRIRASEDPPITSEEVGVLLEQGARAGVFDPKERDMVEGVFALADDRVTGLMTPRPEVTWLDLEDAPDAHRDIVIGGSYSRFPVGRGTLDRLAGVVYAKDLLAEALAGRPLNLEATLRPAMFLPESATALELLERFRQSGDHLAVIVDEYGGTAGLVTVQDVLEAIVGELPTAENVSVTKAHPREDGSWLLDGALAAEDVSELLDVRSLPGEAEGDFETLAGFVLARLGQIPTPGNHFIWENWRFEVVDMDGWRVDTVLASPVATATERSEASETTR